MYDNYCDRALDIFIDLVKIDSPSGKEQVIAAYLGNLLTAIGCSVEFDEHGNLYGKMAATSAMNREKPVLLNCHMDTVPIAVQVNPIISGSIVKTDGTSALGADDKAAIAVTLATLEYLQNHAIEHPQISILFTVQEETGLTGAKLVDVSRLGIIGRGYTLDSSSPVGTVIDGASYKHAIDIEFIGKSAHAGLAPEQGVSAISIAAKAIEMMKLLRIDSETTANIGTIQGGSTTNVVCDRVSLRAEVRSLNQDKLQAQLLHMEACCKAAAEYYLGTYVFHSSQTYPGYRLSPEDPVIQSFRNSCERIGVPFTFAQSGGGSDANILRNKQVPLVVLGVGYKKAHSNQESIEIAALGTLTRLLIDVCSTPVKS
ncbi:MAG: M20/M25/M40 family metallo-hydrolase [Sphaerochaetaceae bacterium]